jgi:photosystem II stability/assembly factor-like uncharacterized protein
LLQLGFNGPSGIRGLLGRLWFSKDSGSGWRMRDVPCTPADDGAAAVAIARGHPDAWLVDCFDNEQSSQAQHTQHHLYGTADAGASWVRLPDPTGRNEPDLLADNGAGHAFLATEGGGGDRLVGTLHGGRHWHQLLASGGSFFGWADLRFVTTAVGFVVGPTHYAPEHIYRTDNAGRTWRTLAIR